MDDKIVALPSREFNDLLKVIFHRNIDDPLPKKIDAHSSPSTLSNNPPPLPGEENDSMGSMSIPSGVLWGCQTQRSIKNFPIGGPESKMPLPIVHAQALLKKCCAKYNLEKGKLTEEVGRGIIAAADR